MTDATDQAFSTAYRTALLLLERHDPVEPHHIDEAVDAALTLVGQTSPGVEVDRERVRKHVRANVTVYQDRSSTLEGDEDLIDWLTPRIQQYDWAFWRHYRDLMVQQKRPRSAITQDDRTTEAILQKLGDPANSSSWDRRGMVVGAVQMGKTSNYIGLMAKAADVGYRVMVVLAGSHNSLRSQTQQRVDTGFLGFDSSAALLGSGEKRIGVGLLPEKHPKLWSFTNSDNTGDFRRNLAETIQGAVGRDPMVFVIKKHVSILENLRKWLLDFNGTNAPDGSKSIQQVPLLLIDDEADYASINTRDPDYQYGVDGKLLAEVDPTRTNQEIRRLLNAFEQSAYVAYTATPFANIFIRDPPAESTFGEDLFPRTFITRIKPPSNYLGPPQLFGIPAPDDPEGVGVQPLPLVKRVTDSDAWVPARHKRDWIPGSVPNSLREALLSFVLVCAARRARGQESDHNSMLVHVTWFVDVQALVAEQIQEELDRVRNHVLYGSGDGGWDAMVELRNLWHRSFVPTFGEIPEDFAGTPVTWGQVSEQLSAAVTGIEVRRINGQSEDTLIYRDHPNGLSVIAVGGNTLSRGLTLEGLTVSYYLRAARMYDTLMQMGRWFGYRGGYADLCRIYTTPELQKSYRQITIANEELYAKFDQLVASNRRPKDFALYVRRSPDGLLVTAPSKMRGGQRMRLTFSGEIIETINFPLSGDGVGRNCAAVEQLLDLCSTEGTAGKSIRRNFVWNAIRGEDVAAFLDRFITYNEADKANGSLLASYVRKCVNAKELRSWTVMLANNTAGSFSYSPLSEPGTEKRSTQRLKTRPEWVAGHDIGLTYREPAELVTDSIYTIGRLADPGDEHAGLSPSQFDRAMRLSLERFQRGDVRRRKGKEPKAPTSPYGPELRWVRDTDNGLLVIYPLDTRAVANREGVELDAIRFIPGFMVAFPHSESSQNIEYVIPERYDNAVLAT